MSFTILIRRRAQKSLAAIQPNDRSRIIDQIQSLAANPRLTGSRKLRGRDGWRIRIGSWRVLYEIDDSRETVTILDIGHRKEERQDPVSAALDKAPEDDEPYRAEASSDDEPLVPHERAKLEFFR